MVKIRLSRLGRHKLPYYRVIVIDSRFRRDGKYIELVGTYEPLKGEVKLKEEPILKWLSKGAQPSTTVKSFLQKKGIWKRFMDIKAQNKKLNAANKKEGQTKKQTKTTKKESNTSKSKDKGSKKSVKK